MVWCAWGATPQVSFVFVIQLILVNLVVAVILESYSEASDSQRRLVSSLVLRDYVDQWKMRDAEGVGFIRVEKLTKLMASVPAPLGFGGTQQAVSEGRIMSVVREMELKLYVGPPQNQGERTQYYVGFHEVLLKLVSRAMCARTADKVAVQAIKASVKTRTQVLHIPTPIFPPST